MQKEAAEFFEIPDIFMYFEIIAGSVMFMVCADFFYRDSDCDLRKTVYPVLYPYEPENFWLPMKIDPYVLKCFHSK